MPSRPERSVTLACHPDTPSAAVRAFGARVHRSPEGRLFVGYVLEGDLDRLKVPPPDAPRIGDRLWEHTCCEIFISRKGGRAYHEFNFSPSGAWAAYAFDGYRAARRGKPPPVAAPRVAMRWGGDRLELDALIDLDGLVAPGAESPLALAISAVVEDRQGRLSYWALRHPPGKPDFHHAQSFALELDA